MSDSPPLLPVLGDVSELDVVLIADRREFSNSIDLDDTYLEFTEPDYFEELDTTLREVARSVVHFPHPSGLLDHIAQHRDHVVLSVWSGERSRNRRSLVPAICEAYGIRYVGGDAFTQAVCADKTLAKVFARRHGLLAPEGVLLQSASQAPHPPVDCLRFPVVVKPNAEGGSIGISTASLVHTPGEAMELARRLMAHYPSVLVEEFVRGREVSIMLAGNAEGIFVDDVLEVELVGTGTPLSETVFGFEYKNYDPYEVRQTLARDLLPESVREAARDLFHGLGKVEVIRIDGRLDDEGFKVIELSPDCHLGSICLVGAAFEAAGWSYADMLRILLLNAAKG